MSENEGMNWFNVAICLLFALLIIPDTAQAHGGVPIDEDRCVFSISGHDKNDRYWIHVVSYQPDNIHGILPEGHTVEEWCRELPKPGNVYIVFDLLDEALRDKSATVTIIPVSEDFDPNMKNPDNSGIHETPILFQTFNSVTDGTMFVEKNLDVGRYQIIVTLDATDIEGSFIFSVKDPESANWFSMMSPGVRNILIIGLLLIAATAWAYRRRFGRRYS